MPVAACWCLIERMMPPACRQLCLTSPSWCAVQRDDDDGDYGANDDRSGDDDGSDGDGEGGYYEVSMPLRPLQLLQRRPQRLARVYTRCMCAGQRVCRAAGAAMVCWPWPHLHPAGSCRIL